MSKKVLFVINTLGQAGAEVALLELLRSMDPAEYEISLYVLMEQGELLSRIPEHVRLLNDRYEEVSVLGREGSGKMVSTVLRALVTRGTIFRRFPYLVSNLAAMIRRGRIWPDKLLWRVISDGAKRLEETFDLAVAYLEGGSAYYVADYVKARKKAAFIHIDYGQAGYTRKLDQDCYLRYDSIFTVSGEVKEHFLAAYPECGRRTEIFHNQMDQEEIKRRSREVGGFTDSYSGIRILTVGRLTYQKAYDYAITALKLLKEEGYPVKWYVLGEGNQRTVLEKKIEEYSLQEDFLLPGAVANPYPYYAQTDIYVHATRFEGKSIAIQEAQILGCPIIASDCSGNREQIVNGADGLLCDLDPETIKESIAVLIKDEEKRKALGRAAADKNNSYKEDMQMLYALME